MDRDGAKPDNSNISQKCNLSNLVVRPIVPGEEKNWNRLMATHHYLGFHSLTGKTLKYVALLDGQWVALIGWGSAVLKCAHREKWASWTPEQKRQRLRYMANNQRFLILPGVSIKNLASRILALNTKRLPADWEAAYGYPLLAVETFVDHHRFAGTCYRAAGWIPLGTTSGYGRKAGVYFYHGQTKTVFVKPLFKKSRQILSAPFLPPELTGGERAVVDLNNVSIHKDPRKRRGIRHSQISILAAVICALLSG